MWYPLDSKWFWVGLLVGAGLTYLYIDIMSAKVAHAPAVAYQDDEHVHADFLVVLDGEMLDFSKDEYQSVAGNEKLPNFHLHDNEGTILHRHADGLTLGEFFASIAYTLTDECFTTPVGESFCSNDDEQLRFFVNGELTANPAGYVFTDTDQLLLYYGHDDPRAIDVYLELVTDEACIYSLTCPERGTPPPESCGLTCEV